MEFGNAGKMAAALLLTAAAMACAPEETEKSALQADRQKIIVEFAVPEAPGGLTGTSADPEKALRKVADAILSRLDAEVRESAKLYEHLPLMALEADAATLMRLLRMPEVVSVQADHRVSSIDQPGAVQTHGAPSGATP